MPVNPADAEKENSARFVCFQFDRQRYAIALDYVDRVLRMAAVTPVPEAPPWVAGVINVHGQVIPVLNLRERLGHPPKAPGLEDRLLIVNVMRRTIAIMADQVTEVLEIPASDIEPAHDPLSHSRLAAALIRREEDMILVIDSSRAAMFGEDDFVTCEKESRGADVDTG